MDIIKRIIDIALIIILVSYLITLLYLNINVTNNKECKVDTMIVLGSKVNKKKPTLLLQERLKTAYAYYKKHPNVNIIVSGGQGDDETQKEAEVMKEYLLKHGVNKNQIYLEKHATNTFENLRNSKVIIDEHKLGDRVGIVTNSFHMKRSLLLAGRVFHQKVDGIVAPNNDLSYSLRAILREPLAFFKSLFFDHVK